LLGDYLDIRGRVEELADVYRPTATRHPSG
jgi:hypothetical protein